MTTAATVTPEAHTPRYEIPTACCAPGNHHSGGDLNQTWTCQRTATIHALNVMAREITATRARADRTRNPRRQANMRRWADEHEARMAGLAETLEAECAHLVNA